jgi:hypothetical protein
MAEKRVIYEIEVDADTNIEAAKTVQDWLQDPSLNWQFYVQDVETKEIVSIELNKDESHMEVPANDYTPMIEK